MTPTESCGQDGVSVTPSHPVSQSQQWLVFVVHYPPNTICPSLQFPLAQTLYVPILARLGEAKVAKMKTRSLWRFYLLVIKCQHKQPQLYLRRRSFHPLLFYFNSCQITEHACTRQPHYMLLCCLLKAGWKMEKVPSVVCLMARFLSSNHTAIVPGCSRQLPSAGHCREKHSF